MVMSSAAGMGGEPEWPGVSGDFGVSRVVWRCVGRRGYPPEFRRKVLDLVESGRPVAEVAEDLGINDQSIYTWRRQDRIARGLEPGLTSSEKTELTRSSSRVGSFL